MLLQLISIGILLHQIWYWWWGGGKFKKSYPPGPWGIPILGNLLQIGPDPHKRLLEWKRIYGPIYSIRLGSFSAVVLNDARIIKEAFQNPDFAGRAQLSPYTEGTEKKGLFFSEGDASIEQRKFVKKMFRQAGIGSKSIESSIQLDLADFMESMTSMIGQPVNVSNLFGVYFVNTVWNLTLGQRFNLDDPLLDHLKDTIFQISRQESWKTRLALYFPLLGKYFGQSDPIIHGFREVYKYVRLQVNRRRRSWIVCQPRDLTDIYFDKILTTANPDSSFYRKRDFQCQVTADLFMASIQPTSDTMEWFFSYMASYPHIQKRLQTEIDQVIGSNRLPTLTDRPKMFQTELILTEVLRMSSTIPLGIFHRTLVDTNLNGFSIPKHTIVISNLYACHHAEEMWDEPQIFDPNRFVTEDGELRYLDRILPFGVGKRGCIGEDLARNQMFLYATTFFQKFSITFAKGSGPPATSFGLTLSPHNFQIEIIPREK